MIEQDTQRNPLEVLAAEFAARYRAGKHPSLSEYADKYPQWADEIRELFPSVVMIEQLKADRQASQPATVFSRKIERLGDYRIVREIGRGGMGIVYEAEQESLGRHVALKVLPDRTLLAPKQLQRFQREAQAAARLHHTNIVPVFGFGEQDGLHYYVMQFIPGRGLDEILNELACLRCGESPEQDPGSGSEQQPTGVSVTQLARAMLSHDMHATRELHGPITTEDGPLTNTLETDTDQSESTTADEPLPGDSRPRIGTLSDSPDRSRPDRPYWRSVASVGVQVSRALGYAHLQGTLHRDIKPANLIMDRQGTVWVADFGLAKLADVDDLTRTGDMVGTLRYMAPERFSGQSDARSDLYSLGLTLYELLTQRPAFDALDRSRLIHQVTQQEPPRPRTVDPHIPRDLETIVLKAISREPGHRYETAEQFAEDLECFLEDRPIRARRITPAERLVRWCRRNRALAGLTAAAFTFLVLAATTAMVGYFRTSEALRGELEQRERAETNLALAIQAFDDIVNKLAPTGVPESIGDVQGEEEAEPTYHPVVTRRDAALLQSLLTFYDRFAEQNATNAKLQRETAKAHRSLGNIEQRLGQFQDAEDSYRRALALYTELADGATEDEVCLCRTEMAAIHNDLGVVLALSGSFRKARDAHRHALGVLQASTQNDNPSAHSRFELARTHIALGAPTWSRRDQFSERVQHQEHALKLLDELVRQQPNNPQYRLAQARTYRHQWWALLHSRQRDDADHSMQRAIERLEKLVDEFPKDPEYRFELSKTYAMNVPRWNRREQRAAFPDRSLRLREAEAQLRRAIREAETLITEHPTAPQYRALIADTRRKLGFVLRETQGPKEAETELRTAIDLQRNLLKQFPTIPSYQRALAMTRSLLSEILFEAQRFTEAQSLVEDSISDLTAYLDANPKNRYAKRRLAGRYKNLAKILIQQGKPALADDAARNAESLFGQPPRRRNKNLL